MTESFDQDDIRRRIAQHYGLDVDPFTAAMVATEMEDLLAKPCMGCGGTAEATVLWVLPASAFEGRMFVPSGKAPALIVPLCGRCGIQSQMDKSFNAQIVRAGITNLIEVGQELTS